METLMAWKTTRLASVRMAALLCLTCLLPSGPTHGSTPITAVGSDGVVLQPKAGVDIHALAARYGARVEDGVAGLYSMRAASPAANAAMAAGLKRDPRVGRVEPKIPLNAQIHVGFDGGPGRVAYSNPLAFAMVHADAATRLADGSGIRVAVLDTGVSPGVPELRGRLLPGLNAIDPSADPWEVPDGQTNQAYGHGTMVAGIIARLAPGAEILPIRVLNSDGTGSMVDVIQGIHFAISQGARVLNISFGTPVESTFLEQALDQAEEAGMVIVASAGNDGGNIRRYPAALGGTISVASVDADLTKSAFSNYGRSVAVVAPGSGIEAPDVDGSTSFWSGTSVAVPFVTAEAALVLSRNPRLPADAAAELVRKTARPVEMANPRLTGMLGKGLIDIQQAIVAASKVKLRS